MSKYIILDDDLVRIYKPGEKKSTKNLITTLFWGDRVSVFKESKKETIIELPILEYDEDKKKHVIRKRLGLLPKKTRRRDNLILKVKFIDVGQGDAAIIETPMEHVILIDGGEKESLRRYIFKSYAHYLKATSLHCDAVVVTHGDADHFSGLTEVMNCMRSISKKIPLITASRVFHNGLVKRSSKSQTKIFGKTKKINGNLYATELHNHIRHLQDKQMNKHFRQYRDALNKLKDNNGRKKPKVQRLEYGDDNAFDFLNTEGIFMKVLGPIVKYHNNKPCLSFLKKPGTNSVSASHTINGNSIVLRMQYGNVRFLFGADLNEEAQNTLLEVTKVDNYSLTSEIFKVPHHGSADFSPNMLAAVRPVVSVISCGDESTVTEYIHPRAGLVGALGKFSRETINKPLIYATEMVAFFQKLGQADVYRYTKTGKVTKKKVYISDAYNKKKFGIVHVRTDGSRVLVATHSGRSDMKEAYVFHVTEDGSIAFDEKPRIIS